MCESSVPVLCFIACFILLVVAALLIMQARDDVINADELAGRCEAAIDDVTSHVDVTSRRLSDVTARAESVSTLVQQQFGDSAVLDVLDAVGLSLLG